MKTNKDNIILEFNLSEFKEKDINVEVSNNSIDVSAYKKDEKEVKKKDFFAEEKTQKSFVYNSSLPSVDAGNVKKSFSKGILKIVIPRA
ncbi:MAG: Hsp20/alpha crystallin family protein [Candidatus Pacearchaeota archaeon]|nr:Hsp20/alpha crystallin family protein [Candidatus Pacearchaeota archaeon]